MKRFVLIIYAFLILVPGFSQDYDTLDQPLVQPRYHFGFGIGTGLPFMQEIERNIENLDASITDTLTAITYTGISSPYIHIIFEFDFGKHTSLRVSPGISLNKFMTYHHWENGDKTTTLSVLNLVRIPVHLNYKIAYKRCSFNFLPGMSYIVGNNNNINLSIPLNSLAVDAGFEFTRNFNNLIAGLEVRYVHMLSDFNSYRHLGHVNFTDKMHMNYMQCGLTLKY